MYRVRDIEERYHTTKEPMVQKRRVKWRRKGRGVEGRVCASSWVAFLGVRGITGLRGGLGSAGLPRGHLSTKPRRAYCLGVTEHPELRVD